MIDPASMGGKSAAVAALQGFWDDMNAGMDPETARALRRLEAEGRRARMTARKALGRPGASDARIDPVAEAHRAAGGAASLPDLFAAIRAFPHCPLSAGAAHTVTHEGPLDAPVLVIGDSPGREDDQHGRPFQGAAGQLLDRMLAAIGLSRENNAFLTNVNYWRVPQDTDPSPDIIAICRPFFTRMIELKRPVLIVAVGKIPVKALTCATGGIGTLHGTEHECVAGNHRVPLIPILQPAFLIKQPKWKAHAWRDLLRIEDRLKALEVR